MEKADKAGKLYREQPFVLGISARRVDEKFPEEEKVLIQGIVDAYFEEAATIVITDHININNLTNEEIETYIYQQILNLNSK